MFMIKVLVKIKKKTSYIWLSVDKDKLIEQQSQKQEQ